ncbi:hypothetical protein CPB84DRAFT_1788634 [Gymnopilus junonius]|uniref:Uncharacterized protein n=1 Tax=Gymnopilus junonius TaxID=109634 RepID=A0A9P5NGL5_GYMJU|nr:hypothetical protein CPB84DRAFT_1788634 [Gymnopilus junonius]
MESPLSPPIRIRPLKSTTITTKAARKNLEAFLEDFSSRSTSVQGGNTAVTVQLQKLATALKEERKREKKGKENR